MLWSSIIAIMPLFSTPKPRYHRFVDNLPDGSVSFKVSQYFSIVMDESKPMHPENLVIFLVGDFFSRDDLVFNFSKYCFL